MNFSKSLLVIPAASILLAAAIGAGACGSSVTVVVPTPVTPPTDFTGPAGYVIGTSCDSAGNVYIAYDSAYIYCDSDTGNWEYDPDQPAGFDADSAYSSDGGDDDSGTSTTGDDDGSASTSSDGTGDDDSGTSTSSDGTGDDDSSTTDNGDDSSSSSSSS